MLSTILSHTQEYKKTHNTFNPILICENRVESSLIDKYTQHIKRQWGKDEKQQNVYTENLVL